MRETVPRMKVLDTSMVDEDIELFGGASSDFALS